MRLLRAVWGETLGPLHHNIRNYWLPNLPGDLGVIIVYFVVIALLADALGFGPDVAR